MLTIIVTGAERITFWIGQTLWFFWTWCVAMVHWLQEGTAIKSYIKNDFVQSVSLWVAAYWLTPLTWWQSLVFILLPMPIALGIIAFFGVMFIFNFATSVVFM